MNTVIVLGADRVGKSTLIRNTEKLIDDSNLCSYRTLHFSEVKPHHNSPTEQFFDSLNEIKTAGKPDLLLCDRFSPDTIFYEQHRHQTGTHDVELSRMVESAYMGHSDSMRIIFLCPPWSDELEARHEKELSYVQGSSWWTSKMLEVRREEHHAYQFFMDRYLDNKTLLDKTQIWKVKTNSYTSIFDPMPDLLNKLSG
jgi:hypothetical protein